MLRLCIVAQSPRQREHPFLSMESIAMTQDRSNPHKDQGHDPLNEIDEAVRRKNHDPLGQVPSKIGGKSPLEEWLEENSPYYRRSRNNS